MFACCERIDGLAPRRRLRSSLAHSFGQRGASAFSQPDLRLVWLAIMDTSVQNCVWLSRCEKARPAWGRADPNRYALFSAGADEGSVRRRCCGGLLRNSRRDFLVNDRDPRQRLLDQAIDELRHGDSFLLRAEIQSGHELTPELRRIPFRSGHCFR